MEERWNAITHGAGASLALAGLVVLIVFSCLYGSIWHQVSFIIYGVSLVLLYLASTLYHGFTNERLKSIFQVIDHAAIYLLIAGTYTPFMLVPLHGPLGWTVFGLMWGVAVIGIVFQVFWARRFRLLSTLGYLLMGWFMVFCLKPLIAALPTPGLWWLLAGGLFYTVGALFYQYRWFPYHHTVWHLFVMAGSAAHYISIFWYVLPIPVG